jgi:hypothetical protein
MSLISDLTNDITGGANKNAQGDLQDALNSINAIQTPTTQQLQLSPLAEYTNAGELSPALMQAAQSGPSAYNNENLSSVPMSDMAQALSQENAIASANGMTPQEEAAIATAEQAANQNTAGQEGAIAQDFAGRGIPASLISAALQNQTAGNNAQNVYEAAMQGQAGAANNALTALSNEGTLAGQMYGQQAGQANTVAAAQNALNQFNAANTQQANITNQANTQAGNVYNTTNAQDISNKNTLGKQTAQIQNQVEAPQEAAGLALQKGQDLAGVNEAMANQQTGVGQQDAGLFAGLLGAGASVGSAAATGPSTVVNAAEGGEIGPKTPAIPFVRGGSVPGQAHVAGNSPSNDTVPARLSPGEVVLPRTVAQNPGIKGSNIARFLQQKVPQVAQKMSPHPSDIASMMRALSELRQGA